MKLYMHKPTHIAHMYYQEIAHMGHVYQGTTCDDGHRPLDTGAAKHALTHIRYRTDLEQWRSDIR
jgi:hypothetical protein